MYYVLIIPLQSIDQFATIEEATDFISGWFNNDEPKYNLKDFILIKGERLAIKVNIELKDGK